MTAQNQKIRQDNIQTADEGTGGRDMLKIWEDQFDNVKRVVDSMHPEKLDTGANTYNALAKRINESVGLIFNQSKRMVEAWGGDDAEKAMNQMNKAYRQAQEIETKSSSTGNALSTHAKQQRQWKQSYGSGSANDSWVKDVARCHHELDRQQLGRRRRDGRHQRWHKELEQQLPGGYSPGHADDLPECPGPRSKHRKAGRWSQESQDAWRPRRWSWWWA